MTAAYLLGVVMGVGLGVGLASIIDWISEGGE